MTDALDSAYALEMQRFDQMFLELPPLEDWDLDQAMADELMKKRMQTGLDSSLNPNSTTKSVESADHAAQILETCLIDGFAAIEEDFAALERLIADISDSFTTLQNHNYPVDMGDRLSGMGNYQRPLMEDNLTTLENDFAAVRLDSM